MIYGPSFASETVLLSTIRRGLGIPYPKRRFKVNKHTLEHTLEYLDTENIYT